MKGKECLKAITKIVNGKEEVFCSFSLMAFKKMQYCMFEECTLNDEITEWEHEKTQFRSYYLSEEEEEGRATNEAIQEST